MARMVGDNGPLEGQQDVARKMDNECHRKAISRGQQTFTLVEQDQTSAKTVLAWIWLNWDTAPVSKLRDAFEDAICFKCSPIQKKAAD